MKGNNEIFLRDVNETYRVKATEYAARTQNAEIEDTSLMMAAVKRAVEATRCGQFPRCSQTETNAMACRFLSSSV